MPAPSTLAVFSVAALALLLVPGPAVVYIVTRSISQGRTAGIVSVFGIATGATAHVLAAALGASAILVSSAHAFTAVKLLGAAYLIGIGVHRLLHRGEVDPDGELPRASLRRIYAHGVVVNVLNPKTALFFLAFLPQFVDPDRGNVAVQVVALGLLFIALGICSDGTYAIVAGGLGERLRHSRRFARRRDEVSGVVFITLGATAALAGHPAAKPA